MWHGRIQELLEPRMVDICCASQPQEPRLFYFLIEAHHKHTPVSTKHHGQFFYCQTLATNEVSWTLPGEEPLRDPWIDLGSSVHLRSLPPPLECYDGQVGNVAFILGPSLVAVQFPEEMGEVVVEVLRDSLQALLQQTAVSLQNLMQERHLKGSKG